MEKIIAYLQERRTDLDLMLQTDYGKQEDYFKRSIAEIDALLNGLKGAGFVFADWFDNLVEQNKLPRIWAVEYKNKIGEDKLTIWVYEFDIPLLQDCNIPKSAHEAEIIFKAFNLL